MKTCFKCKINKPLSAYYPHPQMGDGYLNKCKECTKKDATEVRNRSLEYYRAYDRKRADLPKRIKKRKEVAERWKKDPKLRKITNERSREWREKNTIKRAAHIIVGNAIKNGSLVKKPCEVCGKKKVDAHHDDYSRSLDVKWLCRKHHMEHHKNERERLR